MNFWMETLNPLLVCPWCLWLLKDWSPLGTPSFTNNLPVCTNAYIVQVPTHTAVQHKPALLQEPHCHGHKYRWVSAQHLTSKTCTQPAQSLDRDFSTLPALAYRFAQWISTESKLYPNKPSWLADKVAVPEILFYRLPQSHGSLAPCREGKLLHFPIWSRTCIHRRCPRGMS